MNTTGGGKRRGRPPLPPEQLRRVPVQFRTTQSFRTKLEHAAEESGRSLAQEAEFRLERSFEREQIAGSPEWYGTAILLVRLAQAVERRTGKSAFEDWKTAVAVRTGWKKAAVFLLAAMPEGLRPGDPPEKFTMDLPAVPEAPLHGLLAQPEDIERREAEHDAEMVKWQKEYRKEHTKQLPMANEYTKKLREFTAELKAAIDAINDAESVGLSVFDEIFPEDE